MSTQQPAPLVRITSLKVKLGALVAASVAVAAGLVTLAAQGGVSPWLSIPITIAAALGVTQLLAAGMTAPLRDMTAAARAMARGDYSLRVRTSARDEVGQLAGAFNTMAEDLAAVDRERRDLVATVSHELRTPLTVLGVRLENLADGVEPPTPEVLAELLVQTRRLGGLVTDLLDLARAEAGVRTLQLGEVPLDSFLRRVADELTLPTRSVGFDVTVQPPDLVVRADPTRLRQLVANLLDNAARHSPTGGRVTVSARSGTAGSGWTLQVDDDGPGVPPEQRERAFERFGTLTEHAGGGTGLGLAIARQVATLHGGSVHFVDPDPDRPGARVRLDLPLHPAPVTIEEPAMPAPAVVPPTTPLPQPLPGSGWDSLFGRFWPEDGLRARRDVLLAAIATGVLGGVVLPYYPWGLGTLLVLLAAGGTVWYAARHRREPYTLGSIGLCLVLASTVVLRDAEWIVALCLLAGAAVLIAAVTRGRSLPAFVLAGLAWPLAGLRGLPWLGRTATGLVGRGRVPAVLRTLTWSLLGVGVFALLFASADALFAHWLDSLLPDWRPQRFVNSAFVAVFVGGVVLAAAYLALNPPRVNLDPPVRRPVRHRYEWLVPVLLVDLVFVGFLVSQATVVFGGHEYVQRTAGITYAEYVHQGFVQLTLATALTLLVVWLASRGASRETLSDRVWLRAALGALCLLTLVVVASALYRVQVYQDAYGFTRLRLLVNVFEGWLGLLVLAVLVAGVRLSAPWIARLALLTGAAALAGLALVNPDALIARHNVERFETTGKIDQTYLAGLSADAVPEVVTLPPEVAVCLVPAVDEDDRPLSWNLGRARARSALVEADLPDAAVGCFAGGD